MAFQASANSRNTPTPTLSKADERLAKELALFDYKPNNAFVGIKLVCAVCDRSPSSIQRDVKAGRLDPPIKIGPNASRWTVGAVRQRLKRAKTDSSLRDASSEPIDQLGQNGGPPPVIKVGMKKRRGENG
jgi:predicted DNA-binding transcriptional regulator AlpA